MKSQFYYIRTKFGIEKKKTQQLIQSGADDGDWKTK